MKKLTFPWILLTAGVLFVSVFTSIAAGQEESDPQLEGFANDPILSETTAPPVSSAVSPLTIKSNGDQTNLSVETKTLLSPYLGAVKSQTDGLEYISPRHDGSSEDLLKKYHLETGVGLSISDQAEINLGYRFNDTPSLLGIQSRDPSIEDNGELRFSLDFKVPF